MITQKTAARIWECYREIEAGKQLLADMTKEQWGDPDSCVETLEDCYGHRRKLQLGIPSGQNCHRLFGVEAELAKSVIRAHIAGKQAELVAANEQARIELDSEQPKE